MPDASSTPDEPVRITRNIDFAHRDTGELLLDLYHPAATGRAVPVVLWLHGGGWFTGDRSLAPDLAHHARTTGCAMATVEYRLSGQAVFPAQLHDVRAAIRFLREHAEHYGLDAAHLGLWGGSAGGHLAALAGLTGHLPDVLGEPSTGANTSVQAVSVSYAPTDLAAVVAEAERTHGHTDAASPEQRLLGTHPASHPAAARQASPLSWVSPDAPPFQISHGTDDVLVPQQQSQQLHEALTTANVPSELYLLTGYRHGFLNPPGRADVPASPAMDHGRLWTEQPATALYRTSARPEATAERTRFGFTDIDAFFREHLTTTTENTNSRAETGQPR
ncbi:alpha/beta hydrolase [Actinopolyspora erythraea]|uniref:alpha/beta hydrolase n=1 Tax=Actinopolyspora erythraea TaxID=414996 RepID=UPI0006948C03|nr:alpha/beta hydrolase [Actinopolyspora erythraea]